MFLKASEKTAIIYKDEVISYNLLLKTVSQYSTLFDEAKKKLRYIWKTVQNGFTHFILE